MAAAQKTSKTELVAIYRLEFYKKQKSWKYCSQERKRKEEKRKVAKKAKVKLNLTYNIQDCPERDTEPGQGHKEEVEEQQAVEDEQAEEEQAEREELVEEEELGPLPLEEEGDDLNEAFVDTETDGNATPPTHQDPPNSPYSPKWSIQHWAEQCQPLWHCEPTYVPTSHGYPPQGYPFTEFDHLDPNNGQYTNLPYGMLGQGEFEGVRFEEGDQGWPTRTQVWINRQENDWSEAAIPEEREGRPAPAGGTVDDAEWALLDRAADWLGAASADKSELSRCDSLPSVSSGSFTRGALQAPHSSEIDLLSDAVDITTASLSSAALAQAVARHADALRCLLAEARRRGDQVRALTASTSACDAVHSFEERPTHDAGPAPPAPCPPKDVIITGSFRNRPDLCGHAGVGRGRGKVKVIGIGMGRPYRL